MTLDTGATDALPHLDSAHVAESGVAVVVVCNRQRLRRLPRRASSVASERPKLTFESCDRCQCDDVAVRRATVNGQLVTRVVIRERQGLHCPQFGG